MLAEQLHESQQRILPWWVPASISVFDGKKWQTRKGAAYYPPIFAANPIDVQGYARFAAFDIDSHEKGDMDKLLAALPQGVIPLVSESGKKGWHVWVFPSEPISPGLAREFARRIAEKAGVRCEMFPSSEGTSRCLKWPGCPHPETRIIEEFIAPEDGHVLDTSFMLQAVEDGFYRTPLDVIREAVPDMRLTPQASPASGRGCTNTGTPGTKNGTNIGTLGVVREKKSSISVLSSPDKLCLADWFKRDEVALALVHAFGTRVRGIGRTFRCILPKHSERTPSAALYRCEDNGTIVYHDFHGRSQDENGKTLEFLTMSEVYAAVCSGIVRELPSRHQQACWGWRLLIDLGFVVPPNIQAAPLPDTLPAEAGKVYEGFILLLQTKRLGGLDGPSYFSKQFAASWCAMEPTAVCKAMNLLATIGALQKCGRGTNAFLLGQATTEEMAATYDALGKPSVSEFNKKLVRERVGIEAAEAIFRR